MFISERACHIVCKQQTESAESGSLMNARWPTAGPVDENLLMQSEYLENFAHDLRCKIQSRKLLTQKKNKVRESGYSPHRMVVLMRSCILYIYVFVWWWALLAVARAVKNAFFGTKVRVVAVFFNT